MIQAVHLHSKNPVTRDQETLLQKQYPLNEPDMPKGNGTPQALYDIIKFLHGANRYKRYGITHAGLFAYDVAWLAGAYLPRVWWLHHPKPERAHSAGEYLVPDTEDLRIINNNDLKDWMLEFGHYFGWRPVGDFNTAQQYADVGHLVIIIAQARNRNKNGRLSVIVPDLKMGKPKPIPMQASPGKEIGFQENWYENLQYNGWHCYVNFLK